VGTDAPRSRRHRRIRSALAVLAVVLSLALVVTGLGVWTVTRSFPTLSGQATLPGLGADVTVYRDQAGIPQIVAGSAGDLFRAEGYVHAQDRFWEMDFRRHVTSGRLAELFGRSQVGTDTFIYKMTTNGDTVFVAINRGDSPQPANGLPSGTYDDLLGGAQQAGTITIPARTALVLAAH